MNNYINLKADGSVSVISVDGGYALSYKKYDPRTGNPLPDRVMPISMDLLQSQLALLQSDIDNITAVMTDVKALQNNIQ